MGVSDAALMEHVLAHYRLAAPLIDASFSETPIVFVNYPNGIDDHGVFHVTTVPLSVNKLLWLIHSEYAIEFYTWAPTLLDVAALRFGRILLEAPAGVEFERVKLAALAMRALLFDVAKLEAVPMSFSLNTFRFAYQVSSSRGGHLTDAVRIGDDAVIP